MLFSKGYNSKFKAMRRAGEISSRALTVLLRKAQPGVSLRALDKLAEDLIIAEGAQPAFKRVEGYDFTTCINVNSGIVHGIPNEYVLQRGDVVSIDLGAYIDGYNSDQCWTFEVGTQDHTEFLRAGREALMLGISQAVPGNHIGDISHAIETRIKSAGYSVSLDLVGHGVGKELHESPQVPGYGNPGEGPLLRPGMTLAIEVIYAEGAARICESGDGWTLETCDGSLSAVFEHSIGIRSEKPEIFTLFDNPLSC